MILNIKPFVCPTCAQKIKYMLEEERGIEAVNVLSKFGKIRVRYDQDTISLMDLSKKLKHLGHPVQSVTEASPVR